MGKIYFTSDTHFSHKNICYGTSQWDDKDINCRQFETIEEMNDSIITSINNIVGEDDELYHIGDVSFNGIENIWNFRKQIKCKNIHLILGNHDHHIKNNKLLPNCHWSSTTFGNFIVDGPNENLFNDDNDAFFDVRAKELFTSVSNLSTITINKQKIELCHYPLEQWQDMDRGSWHIHGHCHHKIDDGELNTQYRRIDVGWPTIISFDELNEIMNNRKIKEH